MPPEPTDPELVQQMQNGLSHLGANLIPLLRYQSAGGSRQDLEAAASWMKSNGVDCREDSLVIAPGAHAAIFSILSATRRSTNAVLCESVTYPGIRAICAQLDIKVVGIEEDCDGILPHRLEAAINEHDGAVLYLNPTLRNPTTHTMPTGRRKEIAKVLHRSRTFLIEDDAYRFVCEDAPPSISSFVQDLGWHICGISKAFGAGLRVAYVQAPTPELGRMFLKAMSAANVMTSPLTLALLSAWIEDGTAQKLQEFVRRKTIERQAAAGNILKRFKFESAPNAFNIWLSLPEGLGRAEVMARQAGKMIGIMPSDVFTPNGDGGEKLRVCLGGPISDEALLNELGSLRDSLTYSDWAG